MDLFKGFFKRAGFKFIDTNATFYLWVEAPRGMDGQHYADIVLEHGIIVSPGAFFGDNCKGFFRLALVPSLADCSSAISVWERV
jgi:aspartate/methionine/tyrosine aminotransferase